MSKYLHLQALNGGVFILFYILLISMKRMCFSALNLSSLGHSQLMRSSPPKSRKTFVDDAVLVDPCVIHVGPIRDAKDTDSQTQKRQISWHRDF